MASLINGGADRAQCFSAVLSGRNVCSANKKEGGRDESTDTLTRGVSFLPSGHQGISCGWIHLEGLDDVGPTTTGSYRSLGYLQWPPSVL